MSSVLSPGNGSPASFFCKRQTFERGCRRAGSLGEMRRCRLTVLKEATPRCNKWRPGWRLHIPYKQRNAVPCHTSGLCMCPECLSSSLCAIAYSVATRSISQGQLATVSPYLLSHDWQCTLRGSAVWLSREHVALLSCSKQKSQEGQLTDCQEAWTTRQEGESMWLASEYGPSLSSQNRMGLSCLMTCICKNICPYSKGNGAPYTVNNTCKHLEIQDVTCS